MTKPSQELRTRLASEIDAIDIVDTHEHVPDEAAAYAHPLGLFGFFDHYVSSDLVSAGMPREALEQMRSPDSGLSIDERWALLADFWPYVRHTGYGRAMREYMADLFDVDDIGEDTYAILCERIDAAHRPGWYETVLKDKARIAAALVTTWPGQSVAVDPAYFRAVPILDHYATAATRADLEALEAESDRSIQTLAQLLGALEARLAGIVEQGVAGIKVFLAYRRPLLFERVDEAAAARCFDRIWLSQALDLAFEDLKPLQDFVMWHLVGLAADRGLAIQVHTGLQEGNGNYLENSRPTLLANLFMAFGDARFDLFHAGYPYTGEAAALAKNFANVALDLCWVQAISPLVAARTLDEWIDTVPANKIFAVGGDSNYAEGAYGHCKVARRVACEVLAGKVESGGLSEDEAAWYARRILRENAEAFFRLDLGNATDRA
ncbi:MAG: amidohydrolase family protein [Candidatus Hydrogenedentes bacterium]|nr:amidohydrolase family protein [Candidatus Hydrogenedentota bacterium]